MEVSLIAHLEAVDGRDGELGQRLAELATQVRQEPGNRLFQVYRHRDAPKRFDVVETYADEAAFQSHLAAPHSAVFAGQVKTLAVGGDSTLTFVSAVPGITSLSKL